MSAYLSSLLALILLILTVSGLELLDEKPSYDINSISHITETWATVKRDVWGKRGKSVTLECGLAGKFGQKDIQWYKNNKLVNSRRMVILPNGNLNITRVRRKGSDSDAGEYRCVLNIQFATNPAVVSALSSPITRFKIAELRNAKSPKTNISAYEGGSLRLQCQINSSPDSNVTWFKQQKPLQNSNRYKLISSALQITNLQLDDADIYRCSARNEILNRTKTPDAIRVNILLPPPFFTPTFLTPAKNVVIAEKRTVVIECLATGAPSPNVEWEFRRNSSEAWQKVEAISGQVFFSGQGNLQIVSVMAHHQGIYKCTARNKDPSSGKEASNTQETNLQVVLAPVIVPNKSNITALIGYTIRLNCSYHGATPYSNIRFSWYKDGKLLDRNARIEIKKPNESNYSGAYQEIIFVNSIRNDTGVYQCMVENEAGFSTTWTYLLINSSKEAPPRPNNLRGIIYSATSVLLVWDKVEINDRSVDIYSIHYHEKGKTEKSVVATTNSHKMEGLKPNTEYEFAVRAYAKAPSVFSEKIIIRTPEAMPSSLPEFDVKGISPTDIYVQWTPLVIEKARGKIISYFIRWKRRKHPNNYNMKEVGANEHNFTIGGLYPGKTYKVQVSAANNATKSVDIFDDFPWKTVTMLSDPSVNSIAPKAPVLTANRYKSDNAIELHWNQPMNDKASVSGYILKYKQKNHQWQKTISLAASQSSYVISDLEPDVYKIKLRAYNHAGNGRATNVTVNLTNPQPEQEKLSQNPHPNLHIEKVYVSQVSGTVVNLEWEVSKTVDKLVKYYTIKQQVYSDGDQQPMYLKSTKKSMVIDGLIPFKNYQFSVRAHISEKKYGPYSNPVPMRTNDPNDGIQYLPPTTTTTPQISEPDPVDPSTIRLRWNFPGEPVKYKVAYSDNTSLPLNKWNVKEFDGQTNYGEISGLVSNKRYWFKISACDEYHECGEFSTQISGSIPAVLTNYSLLYWIAGLVGLLLILLAIAGFACFIIKSRNTPVRCSGNGAILNEVKHLEGGPKLNTSHLMRSDGLETNGDYIPMLHRIHADLPSTPLDTKGGYPCTRLNGFTNPRCNGIIRPKDNTFGLSKRAGDVEECESLFTSAYSTSSSEILRKMENDTYKSSEDNSHPVNDTKTSNDHATLASTSACETYLTGSGNEPRSKELRNSEDSISSWDAANPLK